MKCLGNGSMKSFQLRQHLTKTHPELEGKDRKFFALKEQSVKRARLDATGTFQTQTSAIVKAIGHLAIEGSIFPFKKIRKNLRGLLGRSESTIASSPKPRLRSQKKRLDACLQAEKFRVRNVFSTSRILSQSTFSQWLLSSFR